MATCATETLHYYNCIHIVMFTHVKYREGRRIFSAEEGGESATWTKRLWKKIRIKIEDLIISFFYICCQWYKDSSENVAADEKLYICYHVK